MIKLTKKQTAAKQTRKRAKKDAQTKNINWAKYAGKIKFPFDALVYQRKLRNEWGD